MRDVRASGRSRSLQAAVPAVQRSSPADWRRWQTSVPQCRIRFLWRSTVYNTTATCSSRAVNLITRQVTTNTTPMGVAIERRRHENHGLWSRWPRGGKAAGVTISTATSRPGRRSSLTPHWKRGSPTRHTAGGCITGARIVMVARRVRERIRMVARTRLHKTPRSSQGSATWVEATQAVVATECKKWHSFTSASCRVHAGKSCIDIHSNCGFDLAWQCSNCGFDLALTAKQGIWWDRLGRNNGRCQCSQLWPHVVGC